MKLEKVLPCLVVAAMLPTNVKAVEDIASPFYLPSEMENLSTTSLAYNRTNFDDAGAKEDFILRETLLVGFGMENALMASIGNRFNFEYLTNEDYNNDLNLDYELGVKTNLRSANGVVMQLGASYYTYNPRSWYGRNGDAKEKIRKEKGNTRWYKELRGEAKVGYELEDGLMPYASFGIDSNLDDSDRDFYYTAFAGIHKVENSFSFDAGLRYEFETSNDKNQTLSAQGAADYFINDTMTIGGLLDYRLVGSENHDIDYNYTAEARFKILF